MSLNVTVGGGQTSSELLIGVTWSKNGRIYKIRPFLVKYGQKILKNGRIIANMGVLRDKGSRNEFT